MNTIAFRNLKVTTDELIVRMMFNKRNNKWRRLILNATSLNQFQKIFEDMFLENISQTQIKLFYDRYYKLSAQEQINFIDEVISRYEHFGEMGFFTIVCNSLPSRTTR